VLNQHPPFNFYVLGLLLTPAILTHQRCLLPDGRDFCRSLKNENIPSPPCQLPSPFFHSLPNGLPTATTFSPTLSLGWQVRVAIPDLSRILTFFRAFACPTCPSLFPIRTLFLFRQYRQSRYVWTLPKQPVIVRPSFFNCTPSTAWHSRVKKISALRPYLILFSPCAHLA